MTQMGCATACPFLYAHWIDVDISKRQFYYPVGRTCLPPYEYSYWMANVIVAAPLCNVYFSIATHRTAVKGV